MPLTKLLKYGNWSGPGWSGGIERRDYDAVGADRIMTGPQRKVPGIDRADNYVAKSHDLNEFDAQDILRKTLIKLGLASDTKTKVNGRPAWKEKLKTGAGGQDLRRFVSMDQYMADLAAKTSSKAKVNQLGHAFILFFHHLIYSNAQLALDLQFNRVARWRNRSRGSYKAALQMGVAPHLFLGEAHRLALSSERAQTQYQVKPPSATAIRTYLTQNLVTPLASYFEPVEGEAHIPVLKPKAMIAASREELVDAFDALRSAIEDPTTGSVEKKLIKAAPQGFDSLDDFFQFLEDIDWRWM